jgi:Skp family chaperone for outer membrane proteins
MKHLLAGMALVLAVSGCQSAYYAAAEKVGYHKREILVDRVEDARDAQAEAEQQFESAQEHLLSLISFDGGELQRIYEELADEYEDSRDAADAVSERIDAIEDVADALFDEWQDELGQYSNARLRADSERKLKETQRRYQRLVKVMRRSEQRMQPVLAALNDNVLYLKHNLNAQAVAALKTEFSQIDKDIDVLIEEMRRAIASSDEFIESLRSDA